MSNSVDGDNLSVHMPENFILICFSTDNAYFQYTYFHLSPWASSGDVSWRCSGDRRVCAHTVPWFSTTQIWKSRRSWGVGLISFCLLKCVRMDVPVMVALETSRSYLAWPGQSLSCCQKQGGSKAGTNVHTGKIKGFSALHEAGTPWSDSTSRARCPPAPLQGQEMQHRTAANKGPTIPGGTLSLSRQRGGGFLLSEPPDLVTAPMPHLLHRWGQWDKFCPAQHCCYPASSSTPHLLSLPAPLLTSI